jgi:hypothetical protein
VRIARLGPWRPATGWRRLVERGLRALLAESNPDLDPAFEHVTCWWLEVNDDGRAAPLGENLGIFTDSDQAPNGLGEPVSATEFERVWSEVSSR